MKFNQDNGLANDTSVGAKMLRRIFCDSAEHELVSSAQQRADLERQYPQQSRVLPHEPFEPYGLN